MKPEILKNVPEILKPIGDELHKYVHVDPCVYFLVQGAEVVYIGQSVNIGSRIHSHLKDKRFDSVYYVRVHRESLDEFEGALIRALKPCLNRPNKAPSSIFPERVLKALNLSHLNYRVLSQDTEEILQRHGLM
jgi:hypothetical protein